MNSTFLMTRWSFPSLMHVLSVVHVLFHKKTNNVNNIVPHVVFRKNE